jgi:hypothetical protein
LSWQSHELLKGLGIADDSFHLGQSVDKELLVFGHRATKICVPSQEPRPRYYSSCMLSSMNCIDETAAVRLNVHAYAVTIRVLSFSKSVTRSSDRHGESASGVSPCMSAILHRWAWTDMAPPPVDRTHGHRFRTIIPRCWNIDGFWRRSEHRMLGWLGVPQLCTCMARRRRKIYCVRGKSML